MLEKEKNKKQTIKISVIIASIIITLISVTYAFVTFSLTSIKRVVLTAGTLELILEEGNEITISDALPMYDEVGVIQEDSFDFQLINNTTHATSYTIRMEEIETPTLDKSYVKYGLSKDSITTIDFVSNLTNGVLDSGVISGGNTILYQLRLWIDSSINQNSQVEGKSLKFRLLIDATQAEEEKPAEISVIEWYEGMEYLDTVEYDLKGETVQWVKISDYIPEQEDLLGLTAYASKNGEETSTIITTEDFSTTGFEDSFAVQGMMVVPEETNVSNVTFTSGIWTMANALIKEGITAARIVTTEAIQAEKDNILFEWYPEKIVYNTYESSTGATFYRFSTKPLPNKADLIGYKAIIEFTDGQVQEIELTEENIVEDEDSTTIASLVTSVYVQDGTIVEDVQVPVGVYIQETETLAQVTRARIVMQ